MAFPRHSEGAFPALRVEWINCLSGVRGSVGTFPAEMSGFGVSFRIGASGGAEIVPDFRADAVFLNEELLLGAAPLEAGVPVFLRTRARLLACCVPRGNDDDWAALYRFPLWTLFEPETFEAIETVRAPAEIPAALKRNGVSAEDCLASPYGLPACVPLASVYGMLCGNPSAG